MYICARAYNQIVKPKGKYTHAHVNVYAWKCVLVHTHIYIGMYTHVYTQVYSDKRAATSVDPPGRSLRICRLSPLIWRPRILESVLHQLYISLHCTCFLSFFQSLPAYSILQIQSRMIHCERWRKRDVIGVSSTYKEMRVKGRYCCLVNPLEICPQHLKCKVKYRKQSSFYQS